MIDGIETEFEDVYDKGTVVKEFSYHQPGKEFNCGCELMTTKGAYRDIVIDYEGYRYYYLHQNLIAIADEPDTYYLSNAGHETKTTKDRLRRILPSEITLFQENKEWYIEQDGERREFENGMKVEVEKHTN